MSLSWIGFWRVAKAASGGETADEVVGLGGGKWRRWVIAKSGIRANEFVFLWCDKKQLWQNRQPLSCKP